MEESHTPNHRFELLLFSDIPTSLAFANFPCGDNKASTKEKELLFSKA